MMDVMVERGQQSEHWNEGERNVGVGFMTCDVRYTAKEQ